MKLSVKRVARALACAAVAVGALIAAVSPATAQEELGCCQFLARAPDGGPSKGQRRCDDLSRRECSLLKPGSVFLRRWKCEARSQRCILGALPNTPTPSPTPTRTATPTPTEARGCCQVDNIRTIGHSICGNDISMTSCLRETKGEPVFCADCGCSSHPDAGFSFDLGVCATHTPPPTATATPAERRGCCQLSGLRGTRGAVCGNDVRESTCLHEFDADAVFCADCVCSSHSGSGVNLLAGLCVQPTPTPGTRPRATRRPNRGPHHRAS